MNNDSEIFSKIAKELRATLASKEESLTVDELNSVHVVDQIQKISGEIDKYEKDHLKLIAGGNKVTTEWIDKDKSTVKWFKDRIADIGQ
ncbi:MAG: hypothetical protein JWM14_1492 [Chitinophagaceae bacterium]|nr:hypothetical protein [Chitinophagaceae bacterium]